MISQNKPKYCTICGGNLVALAETKYDPFTGKPKDDEYLVCPKNLDPNVDRKQDRWYRSENDKWIQVG